MKLTAKVKLCPSPEQAALLRATILKANECCNWFSGQAWESKKFRMFALSGHGYREAKATFALNSQLTVMCVIKVCDAYALDKKHKREFEPSGAIAFDDRILSWKPAEGLLNIWTVGGRQKMPFVAGPRQLEMLKNREGQSDLIYQRGEFYLAAVCNVEAQPMDQVSGFLGVDLGVASIATDSDGGTYSGSTVKSMRHRHRRLRSRLQARGTRSAKRRLRALSGKERRFSKDVNHCISKQIVAKAKGSGRGISIENLKGIRNRITVRHKQRAVLHSWAFSQLRLFLEYKAALAGVPLLAVDPRNSSRECSECGHIDKRNRPSQSKFQCLACQFTANADFNAARVLSGRASSGSQTRPEVLSCKL